jgi:hypothetical protein
MFVCFVKINYLRYVSDAVIQVVCFMYRRVTLESLQAIVDFVGDVDLRCNLTPLQC